LGLTSLAIGAFIGFLNKFSLFVPFYLAAKGYWNAVLIGLFIIFFCGDFFLHLLLLPEFFITSIIVHKGESLTKAVYIYLMGLRALYIMFVIASWGMFILFLFMFILLPPTVDKGAFLIWSYAVATTTWTSRMVKAHNITEGKDVSAKVAAFSSIASYIVVSILFLSTELNTQECFLAFLILVPAIYIVQGIAFYKLNLYGISDPKSA